MLKPKNKLDMCDVIAGQIKGPQMLILALGHWFGHLCSSMNDFSYYYFLASMKQSCVHMVPS